MARPTLVKDLSPGAAGSNLEQLTAGRRSLYFIRSDSSSGRRELWKSEGTTRSTIRLRDLGVSSYGPRELITLGDTLFFVAHQPETGFELWRSDGSRRGTGPVRDLWPGAIGSQPASLAVMGGRLYFSADDGSAGRELWSSDGTARGTGRVADLVPGFAGSGPSQLTAVGATLLFAAGDSANQEGSSGVELWRSDGTAAGTRLLKDINPTGDALGPRSSDPRDLTVLGSTLLFTAVDAVSGRELWRSDGTPDGTVRLADLRPGLGIGSEPAQLTPLGDRLLFTAFDADATPTLWLGDGTVGSPRRLIPLTQARSFTAVGDTAFFVNEDRAHGRELWRSDGSRRGTRLLKDFNPRQGYVGPISSDPTNLTAFGDSLLFTVAAVAGDGSSQGQELWRSDGTPAGTVQVADLWPGEFGSAPEMLTVVGERLYFTADDGRRGRELWSLPLPAGPGARSRSVPVARGPAPAVAAQPARRSLPGAPRRQPLLADPPVAAASHPPASARTLAVGERRAAVRPADRIAPAPSERAVVSELAANAAARFAPPGDGLIRAVGLSSEHPLSAIALPRAVAPPSPAAPCLDPRRHRADAWVPATDQRAAASSSDSVSSDLVGAGPAPGDIRSSPLVAAPSGLRLGGPPPASPVPASSPLLPGGSDLALPTAAAALPLACFSGLPMEWLGACCA